MKKCLFLYLGNFLPCLVITVILAGSVYKVFSQKLPSVTDGFDYAAMDQYVEEQMKDCRIPGFSLGIVKEDKVLYQKGYGIADNTKRAVDIQTPFIIASVTKTFTALAVMQLKEAGKLDLDMPVYSYIPDFEMADSRYREITVRQLLNHTAGFGLLAEFQVSPPQDMNKSITELVNKFSSLRLKRMPGTEFEYCNAGFIVLGEVISRVSGLSYNEYLSQYIFKPLEMEHTYTSMDKAKEDGLASGYLSFFGYPRIYELPYESSRMPAYGIISCTEALTHYMLAIMNGGVYNGTRILSEEGITEMTSPSSTVSPNINYGLGWHVTSGSIYHGGELANYQAMLKILPEDRLGVVFLYNASSSTSAKLFNVGYRTRIESGIVNILYGFSPSDQPGQNPFNLNSYPMSFTYNLLLVLIALAVLLLTVSVYRLRSMYRRLGKTRLSFWRILIISLLYNVLLPIYILLAVPRAWSSWSYVLYYVPDISWFLLIYSGLLLVVCIYKIILIIKFMRSRNGRAGLTEEKA